MKPLRGATNLILLALSLGCVGVGLVVPQKIGAPKTETPVNFSREVLPILSDKCFKCHGPDSESRMANLRLDTSEGAFASRGGRFAIVPKKPADSLLVKRITSHDSPMPPEGSGKTLSKGEIKLISRWIAEGAVYNTLWSLEPLPARVPVPSNKETWVQDEIDQFVLASMKRVGLSPSKPASRSRWLRRVTLDLTGLPPTEFEIKAFLKDAGPKAFEHVVNRLLASPHFGERMAVDWLDAARYSDSYGYQSDLISPTWPYRDWVVSAFNRNLPYDEFLTEQIAGDLLPNATRDQVLATAFNRLHRQSNEGGSIPLEFKTTYASDRVETYGTAVLGLTVGCARCHDHKFDPLTQREYYQLFAYFNNINEFGLLLSSEIVPTPSLLLPSPEQQIRLKVLRLEDARAKAALKQATDAKNGYSKWLETKPDVTIPGLVGRFSLDELVGDKFKNEIAGGVTAARLDQVELRPGLKGKAALLNGDNGVVVRGMPGKERYDAFTWSFWLNDPRATPAPIVLQHRTGGTDVGFCGFDLILEDGYLTARVMRHWPGNAVAIRTRSPLAKQQWQHVAWSWDGSSKASGLKIYRNGSPVPTDMIVDKLWKKISAYGDHAASGGDWAFGQRFRDLGFKGGMIDDIACANRALSDLEVAQLFDGHSLADALASPNKALAETYSSAFDTAAKQGRDAVRKSQTDLTNAEEGVNEVSVMEEAKPPVPAHLLARGAYDAPRSKANEVTRGVPKALPSLRSKGPNNRLALARWTVQPNHPLTSRVAVNRIWQMLFGTGLVESSENFGVQGSRPTHPDLLDYLARNFVDSGWDVKAIIQRIVLSSTYRQDSTRSAKGMAIDPTNVWLSRGPSQRLAAEMVRDTALAASGLLADKMGGPPVNPYQPAGIWQEFNGMSPAFVQSKGADLYRRSLYSTWKRTTPVPSMMMFDATSREACTIRRPTTNTPLQALVLLNDVQFVEAARRLGEYVLKLPLSDEQRLKVAFLKLSAREPDKTELKILLESLKEQRAQFQAVPDQAKKLISVGESTSDASIDPVDLAAMTLVMQTILNSDAVIWKR